jgi:hypothetical protein
VADEFAPLTTHGCIVEVKQVSLAFECLVLIDDQVFLASTCRDHKSRLIALPTAALP